ncbi:Hypp6376 [Branchiostoma lanceolatum]|uniref:Hypp6376 protein n=1 Tax=Branchiostoma lanceolatum TaxID=7740 RepID=A0A8J9YTR7_BRALA|nr:Hypp6376 [Branchiostoma lanceolatum]
MRGLHRGRTLDRTVVSCCYGVAVDVVKSNTTTCTLQVEVRTNQNPTPASSISFPEDTFAHVAIGCGGGIVVMLCLVFALGAICNKDQKKQAKYKAKIGEAGNQQKNVQQPRSPSQDTPRRPALDAVFATGPRPGSHAGYDDRAMVDPPTASQGGYSDRPMPDPRPSSHGGYNGRPLPDPREQSAPYDDPRRQDNDGYDNRSFQDDDYERPRHQSQFAAPPREHPQQMRRHTEAPPHGPPRYDNHGEAARNFNDPYDGYDRYDRREGDRHGRYSEMPQYDRGMRTGPPADFDMY